jgi:hypothetical protein
MVGHPMEELVLWTIGCRQVHLGDHGCRCGTGALRHIAALLVPMIVVGAGGYLGMSAVQVLMDAQGR